MTVAIPVDPIDRKHLLTFCATELNDPPLHRTQDSSRCHLRHQQNTFYVGISIRQKHKEGHTMTVKLIHYWTIINSRKDDYNKFVLNKFIPGVNQLGLHTVAGWCVLVGAYSEIVMECVASDLDRLEHALNDSRYKKLKSDLLNSVKSYKTKVLVETGKISSYSTDIAGDTVKFNQTWNLIGEKKEAYGHFTREVYYPLMEELGIAIAGEWEVWSCDSPCIIC